MENITIKETYTLPSLGKMYQTQFDPQVELRSMTVAEEMKRLTSTDQPYNAMASIIDSCILNKLPISTYDMCIGDYQYLLHKLRTVTYGSEYKLQIICPYCGEVFTHVMDLDSLAVHTYDESLEDLLMCKLPVTGDTVEIKYQTPRDLDYIDKRKKELKKQFPDMKDDPTLMLNLLTIIKSINGLVQTPALAEVYIKKLPLKDYQVIMRKANELNRKVGVDIDFTAHCEACDSDINSSFRFTNEFFRPTED